MKAHRTIFLSADKGADILALCVELGVSPADTAFLGDDLIDLPAMKEVGLSVAVADSAVEVLKAVDMVLEARGGEGALRELVTIIMKARGDWYSAIEGYTG